MRKLMLIPFLILFISCESDVKAPEEEPPIDPQEAILGKWELVLYSNPPYPVTPSYYEEYLPDGTVRRYDYEKEEFRFRVSYWFEDGFLRKGDEYGYKHSYKFYEDKMQLKNLDLISIQDNTEVYQRIK